MTSILTFLGKGGTGRTTVAIAAAFKLASLGSRVLLVEQDPGPSLGILLGITPKTEPQEVATNFHLVQLQSTLMLERSWEELKGLESQYLRSPTLKNVYGQELGILPGMDSGLALNALREYYKSGKYDAIVYDGTGDLNSLRMLGTPEVLSWYLRRFQNVLSDSDVVKAIAPFVQPIASAILNVSWGGEGLSSDNKANQLLDEGKASVSDPKRFLAYLVTTERDDACATAKYLWGSAQQIGLTIGGVLLNQASLTDKIKSEFSPLAISELPQKTNSSWEALVNALPNFRDGEKAPLALTIDQNNRQVQVFLPGFDKKQVKLTQSGPEITVEAGDQRRNILLPPPLEGQTVKGAKFQDNYLIISL